MMMHRCIDDFHLEQKQQQQHEGRTGLPFCHLHSQDHHDGDLKTGMVIIMVIMAKAEQEGSI